MNIIKLYVVSCALLFFAITTSVMAMANSATEGNWQFNLAPFYLWGISIDGYPSTGTDKIPGNSQLSKPVEVPFGDDYDVRERAFIVQFEAMHNSNWGIVVDVDYLDLGNDSTNGQEINLKVDFEAT